MTMKQYFDLHQNRIKLGPGFRHADGEGAEVPEGRRGLSREADGVHCGRRQGVLEGEQMLAS